MNPQNVLMHVGSLRTRYPFLPRSTWAKLNELKRTESFSDLPRDCGPGSPVLLRYLKDQASGIVSLEVVLVDGAGQVIRIAEPLAPLPASSPSAAA